MKFGRKAILSCVVALMFVFVGTLMVVAQEQKPPEVVVIKAPLWEKPTKAPVKFSHQKHVDEYKVACTECHHTYKDGKNVWKEGDPVKPCWDCHTEATIKGEKKLPKDQQKLNLKLAFHNNCVKCHKAYKKEHKDTKAPTTCSGCHPKKKK